MSEANDTEAFIAAIRRLQKTPEEVAQMAANTRPFSYDEWLKRAGPATPEELADWEEFLREREAERRASREREACLQPVP